MRLALIVDNPLRDLPGLTLLSMYLCQHGADCFLIPMYLSQRETWSIIPDFILYHYLRPNNRAEIRHVLNAGIKVGLLDTEGSFSHQTMEGYRRALVPEEELRFDLSFISAWGPIFTEYAVKESWYRADQVKLTGQPRFDFYADPWREVARRRTMAFSEVASPIVLINSNIFLVNSCFQTPENDIEVYVNVYGLERQTLLQWKELEQKKLAALADLTNDLAGTFPEVNFVFRPHPFEKAETYHKLMEPRNNLFIIKKGSVDGWILRSLAVVQHGCSTAIEAGMAGVPSFSPQWIKSATRVETAESVSVPCESREKLFAHISQVIEGAYHIPPQVRANIDQLIGDGFYRVDGCAHQRVGQAILKVSRENTGKVDLDYCRRQYWSHDGSLKGRLGTQLKKILGLTPEQPLFPWQKISVLDWHNSDKYYNAEQVNELVQAIEPVAVKNFPGKWRPIKVAMAGDDYILPHAAGESVVMKPI